MGKIRGGSGAQERPARGSLTGDATPWTRGPWTLERLTLSIRVWGSGANGYLAVVHQFSAPMNPKRCEAEANAHLIAAAPALYDALEELTRNITAAWPGLAELDPVAKARAALSLARPEGCAIKPAADGEGEADRTQINQAQPSKEANPHG